MDIIEELGLNQLIDKLTPLEKSMLKVEILELETMLNILNKKYETV